MLKKICLFLLILLLPAGLCQAKELQTVSGAIVTGFRVLPVESLDKELSFTVYRGDYIKFSYPENAGALSFAAPELKYKDTIQPTPEKSPFFKMKATGEYVFSLGPAQGKIRVIELIRPNYTEVTAKQAAEILNNLKPFILDVRTVSEHKELYIPDSHLIPIRELQARVNELATKKHEDVFIYCATGNRSTVASRILADLGFKRIYNLRFGIYDWARNGYPVSSSR